MAWRNRTLAMGTLGNGAPITDVGIFPLLPGETADSQHAVLIDRIGFGLFLLATAMLLLRPVDSIPALLNAPIYQFIVSACLCLSGPRIKRQFSPEAPARAITQLIFGLWL